jgi:hypothetical protein
VTHSIALLTWLESARAIRDTAADNQLPSNHAAEIAAAIVREATSSLNADATTDGTRQSLLRPLASAEEPILFRSPLGGLLLLIRLFFELDLYSSLAAAFPDRSLAWTLAQMAMGLANTECDDPALLVFAGLAPSAPAPTQDEPDPTPPEAARLKEFSTRIELELENRLGADFDLARPALLSFIFRRVCRIEADPGWIRAVFTFSDVSTAIRRAGLDLDPGYIRWLGITVVFRYE